MKEVTFLKKKFFFNQFSFLNLDKKINGKVKDIKTLSKSNKNDLTFFDLIKYKSQAVSTRATYCITTEKLKKFLPAKTEKIIVKNVLFELARVLKNFILMLT